MEGWRTVFQHGTPDAHAIYGNLYDLRIGSRHELCERRPMETSRATSRTMGPRHSMTYEGVVNPDWLGSNNDFRASPRASRTRSQENDAVRNRRDGLQPERCNQSAAPNAVTFYVFDGEWQSPSPSCARRRGRQDQPANVHGVSWWNLRFRHAFGHGCAVPAVRRLLLRAQLAGLDTRSTIRQEEFES